MHLEKMSTATADEKEQEWVNQAEELQAELEECQDKPTDTQRQVTVTQWPQRGSKGICSVFS